MLGVHPMAKLAAILPELARFCWRCTHEHALTHASILHTHAHTRTCMCTHVHTHTYTHLGEWWVAAAARSEGRGRRGARLDGWGSWPTAETQGEASSCPAGVMLCHWMAQALVELALQTLACMHLGKEMRKSGPAQKHPPPTCSPSSSNQQQ
eukprot:1161201-Pelagomonas_calceolata.AAC.20